MKAPSCEITPIDLATWPRKQHFAFFKEFSLPYFNVCVSLDMAALYTKCKTESYSFFHCYVYLTLEACHDYAPMRQRIIDCLPVQLSSVRGSVVELAEDETFRFSYFEKQASMDDFSKHAIAASKTSKAKPFFSDAFAATEGQPDLIHISVLPWLNFTGFSHAVSEGHGLGIPKFVFGQYDSKTGKMPLSIDVHHALMDGLHVARFVKILQDKITNFCN
ncbi:MAG: chloramphenicol acetyltransferase [Pseudoalteromonas sp.]|uniref:CatA-like O-acetyltransferase n=1 Tax=Pseudoalteromonas TaxID=53246 RepID=UPI000C919067|nr:MULTISPECIES: CatA-like O-acetyltransferase [Pseudoalteromonas]MAD04684.1 chloramphenicol acetyltransferase [Pseudoalteromonas sp.]NIZ04831.1 chloramphenicol acetyltransferase [Pseudoalteromonas sp. HF66]|tara:strand:+ start:11555 stop:12211 length:657 start_codon:yes stop_codon:yes gene_type:complete